jgi:C1A family cysteine protease
MTENFSSMNVEEEIAVTVTDTKSSIVKVIALVSAAIVAAVLVIGHTSSSAVSLNVMTSKSPVVKPMTTTKKSTETVKPVSKKFSSKKDGPHPEPVVPASKKFSFKRDDPEPEPESSQLRGSTTTKTDSEPVVPDDDEPVNLSHVDLELLKNKKHTIYSTMPHDDHLKLFHSFKSKFQRKYTSTHEEDRRLDQFKKNMALIDARNVREIRFGGTAVHGVTKFSDLSREEIKKRYTNYKKNSDKSLSRFKKVDKKTYHFKKDTTEVDWSGTLANEVRDQGYCGSCWAFSAAEQIESDAIRAGYLSYGTILSEQQIVSCDPYDLGCDGGNTETAYYYVYTAGGLTTDENYPYTSYWADTGECTYTGGQGVVTVDAYYTISGESNMKDFVLSTGPLSICLDASSWSSYKSGIVSSCGNDIDHCVQAVGINTDKGYWKIRNSWGTDWGDEGYIYLKYGSNVCGLTYDPTYTSVQEVSNYYGPKSAHKSVKKAPPKGLPPVASGM